MKNYRLGNTITIKWTIMTATGTAYNLNASNLELFAVVPNHTIKIDDFSVAGNVVTWTFLGTDQKFTGPYTLTLIENRGQSTMMTVDYCNAFGLVRWSCQAGWDESADVNSNLSLTSEIFTHQIALSKEVQAVIDGNITEYNVSNHFPTGGIDGTNRYTLATAIAKIPESLRNVGIKCSFLNEAGEIETRQYNGGDFQEASNWGLTNVQSDIGNYNLNILAPGNYTLETAVNKLQELIPNKRFQYGIKLIFNDANGDTHSYTFCYDGNNGGITNLTRWTEEVDNPYFDFHKQHTGVAYDVAYYISEIKVEALSENVDIDADYSIGMFGYSPSYQQNIIQILKDGAFIGFLLFGNGLTATLETDDIKITITVKTFAPYTERVAVYSSNDNIIKRQLFINAKILYISSSIDKELSITSGNAVQNSAITGRLSATTYIPKDTTSTLEDILKNIPEHELSLVKRIVYLDKNRADRPTIAVACARNISALPDVGSWILLDVRELNAVANMAALSGFNMGSMPSYTLEEIVSGFLGTQKVMPGKIIIYKDKSDGYTVALFNSDSTISGWTNIANWVKVPFSSLKNLVTKSDLEKKVDKITGKGLSTNDYTDKDKKKLNSIDPDAFISEDMIREAVTAYVNENSGGFVTQERGLNVIDYFTYEVGENILENATVVGTGWSGDLASGYTHQAGNTEPLEFALPGVSNGDRLLVRFSADITSEDNDILVSVGDSPQIKSYNGTSSIAAGLIFTEGNLRITPRSGFSGTITDISCCVIDKGENRVTLNQRIVRNLPNDFVYGFWNVFIGVTAAKKLQDGTRSIAIGEQAMQGMIVGNRNVAIGTFSMPYLTRGENNVAIGSDTIYPLVEADNCVGIGKQTLGGNKTAKDCVAIGMNALGRYSFDKDRARCVGVGVNAGPSVSENCTHIGYRAGANVLGANNTSIGYNAMAVGERSSADIVGSELTCVGYKSEIANTDEAKAATNSTAIGANTTITKSNQVIIGNNAVEEVIIAGKKIIFYADGTVKWETA